MTASDVEAVMDACSAIEPALALKDPKLCKSVRRFRGKMLGLFVELRRDERQLELELMRMSTPKEVKREKAKNEPKK